MTTNKLTQVATFDLYDQNIPICVSANGRFFASLEGDTYQGDLFADVWAKLEKLFTVRNQTPELSIPVTVLGYDAAGKQDDDAITHAILRGHHGSQRNGYLFASVAGKKFKAELSPYRDGEKLCRRLTDEQVAELQRLRKASRAADKARDNYEESITVSADSLIAAEQKARASVDAEPAQNRRRA